MTNERHSNSLMPIAQAKSLCTTMITPVDELETVALSQAVDRVVGEDIISPINVPAYDNSAMDGYAICVKDLARQTPLKLIGKSFAGNPFEGVLAQGQCVRIMTGAEIPKGADAVIMQENAQVHDDQVTIVKSSGIGEAIRPAGDDIQQGSVVLPKGRKVTPIDIGVLASLGLSHISVFRKIKVALFSTGDELLSIDKPLEKGKIFDSNRAMLNAMLIRAGFEVLDLGLIRDDKSAIEAAFLSADAQADCVITSGGVSVGEADYTREVLNELGDIAFWKLAIKPGKPLAFGRLSNSLFFGLPGNPVSAAVTFEQIALPALKYLSGQSPEAQVSIRAIATQSFKKRPGRTDFQRGYCYGNEQGELLVSSARSQSSGVLSSFITSNCYIVLEQMRGQVEKGEFVTVVPFVSPIV